MPPPTRAELESWKRPALQQKCKEFGIKANSKSEVLIDLILNHYKFKEEEPASGPSKPTISGKRKADATIPETQHAAEQASSGEQSGNDSDAVVGVRQRQAPTRRRIVQNPAVPPPAKVRRLASRTRPKVEPDDGPPPPASTLQASPRHAQIVEVVMSTPLSKPGKGKAKAQETTVRDGTSTRDQDTEETAGMTKASPRVSTILPATRPLEAHQTSATILDTAADTPIQPQLDAHETRITDLELQIRNARKSSDESAREVLALKAFQHAIQQSFGDHDSSDTLDNMGQLAKLRDIAPKLIALSNLDPAAITARIEIVESQIADLETIVQKDQSTVAELMERIRELEEGKSAVGDLEVVVRQLQSQFNKIPDSVFEGNRQPEDSATDRIYTIIRAPSRDTSVAPQQRPPSTLSVPPEDNLQPPVQDQNQNAGRSSSVARSVRGSRPPLAEKEGVRVGQPDIEVETADPRRSIRRLAESLPPSSGNSAPSSRARSTTPSQRESSNTLPTPSRGKGKGRMTKKPVTALDTVNEDGDVDELEEQPAEEQPVLAPTADPFTPTMELPRSPPDAERRDSSGSPPPSASKPYIGAQPRQGPGSSLMPLATLGDTGPIAELPFKLVASPTKPSENSSQSTSTSTGRVAKTSRRLHVPSARPAGSRVTTLESVIDAPAEETQSQAFNFAMPGAPPASNAETSSGSGTSGPPNTFATNPPKFITPERLGANFSMFPSARFDFGRTPGGLAFKVTGRDPPGTPAVTTTMYGTEVSRDTRFADLPYDQDTSRESLSWEEGIPIWPSVIPRPPPNQ